MSVRDTDVYCGRAHAVDFVNVFTTVMAVNNQIVLIIMLIIVLQAVIGRTNR